MLATRLLLNEVLNKLVIAIGQSNMIWIRGREVWARQKQGKGRGNFLNGERGRSKDMGKEWW